MICYIWYVPNKKIVKLLIQVKQQIYNLFTFCSPARFLEHAWVQHVNIMKVMTNNGNVKINVIVNICEYIRTAFNHGWLSVWVSGIWIMWKWWHCKRVGFHFARISIFHSYNFAFWRLCAEDCVQSAFRAKISEFKKTYWQLVVTIQ